ncbi:MAG: BatA domain-containing protein [Phycisphaerae bacterium]
MIDLPLAAMNFSDPVMLLGLLAAGIPVLLHLLNRVRSPIVRFSTLRFLRVTAQKTSRKRQVQQFVLLLLRMAVFAMIAMAIAGPLVHGGSPFAAYGMLLLLLGGIAVLAVMTVIFSNALDQRKSAGTVEAPSASIETSPAPAPGRPGLLWPVIFMLVGLAATVTAIFGLGTDSLFPNVGTHFNGQSTACVIILDNSQSMLVQDGTHTRLQTAIDQTRDLLGQSLTPARMAVLLTNPGNSPVPDHLGSDRVAQIARLNAIKSTGRALPMRQLISQAVNLLKNSIRPNRMLIIISDFAGPAASDTGMFAPLKKLPGIQLVLMPQATGTPDDVAIARWGIEHGAAVVGATVRFRGTVINNGATAVAPRFGLNVDGKKAPDAEARATLGPGGTDSSRANVTMAYQLRAPGLHRFTLTELDSSHAMDWGDCRSLILRVKHKIRALVVGNQPQLTGASTAFYVNAALAPFSKVAPAGAKPALWSIQPTYRSYTLVPAMRLSSYSAIFICDVPRISPTLAQKLHRFVMGGGRLCWLLGPAVNAHNYNAVAAGSLQLLPGEISGPVSSQTGAAVNWVDVKSHIFAGLFQTQEPFQRIVVVGRWSLPGNSPVIGKVLSRLHDDSLLLVQHSLGHGRVYTFLSAPGGGWSNIASTSAFLPMMVRIALGNAAASAGITSYTPGRAVPIYVPTRNPNLSINVTAPQSHTPVNVSAAHTPEGRLVWRFIGAQRAGVYHWKSFNGKYSGEFIVNVPSGEADLHPTSATVLAKEAPKKQTVFIAATARKLVEELSRTSEGNSLMPGILALVMILAIIEALLANRYRPVKVSPDQQLFMNARRDTETDSNRPSSAALEALTQEQGIELGK